MHRLDAADFVNSLTPHAVFLLADALGVLHATLTAPSTDRVIAAAKERVICLLADEEPTQPMGTVR